LDCKVLLKNEKTLELEDAEVYIHVKGYSLARVTHLDIEHEKLNELLPAESGKFLNITGTTEGIVIKFEGTKEKFLIIECELLKEVLASGEKTRTWVGGKEGGIYIGFRKAEIEKLEKIASKKFGIEPRKYVD